ncbi:hypothetical protein AGIG_G11416 [Arapaima gigas]
MPSGRPPGIGFLEGYGGFGVGWGGREVFVQPAGLFEALCSYSAVAPESKLEVNTNRPLLFCPPRVKRFPATLRPP